MIRFATPLLALTLLGCNGWGGAQAGATLPADLETRRRLQVWSDGRSQVLHAIRLGNDTLSGVPYWQAPECDSCRVLIPSARVDSVRVRTFSRRKTVILVGAVGLFYWLLVTHAPAPT
jgi:hypothetical protein